MGAASNFVAAKFTAVATTLGEKKAKCQAELVVDVRFWATHEYFQRKDIQMLRAGSTNTYF